MAVSFTKMGTSGGGEGGGMEGWRQEGGYRKPGFVQAETGSLRCQIHQRVGGM